MRANVLVAVAVICTILPFAGQFYGDRAGGWLMIDFRAYYCAALAQREGLNPYFAASLNDCEHQTPAPYYHPPRNVTVPAPYPPYALAFFAPLTLLPFGVAALAWWIVLALCLALAAYALSRIAAQPLTVAWAALVLSLGLASWTSGNVVLFAIAALVLAALFVQEGNSWAATVAIALAMIEPQIALPAAIALFVACRPLRLKLAGAVAILGIICVLVAGVAQTSFYLTTVVPAHALSEVSRDNQYSVSTVLSALGASDSSAVLAGSVGYIVMSVVGIAVALRLARIYNAVALVVLVPPAISLLGGSFVHTGEIAAAVPAALVLLNLRSGSVILRSARFDFAQHRLRARLEGWLLAALILLAVPWMLAVSAVMFLAPLYPAAYLAYALWGRDRTLALAVAVVSAAIIFGLFSLVAVPAVHALGHARVHPPIDPRLAEAGWRELVLGNTTNRPIMWLLRLPTWVGLLAFAAAAITPVVNSRRLAESRA